MGVPWRRGFLALPCSLDPGRPSPRTGRRGVAPTTPGWPEAMPRSPGATPSSSSGRSPFRDGAIRHLWSGGTRSLSRRPSRSNRRRRGPPAREPQVRRRAPGAGEVACIRAASPGAAADGRHTATPAHRPGTGSCCSASTRRRVRCCGNGPRPRRRPTKGSTRSTAASRRTHQSPTASMSSRTWLPRALQLRPRRESHLEEGPG